MTEQITAVHALCVDGPQAGETFECPPGHPQLTFWGDRYRLVGSVNGVAQYQYVTR
jgi:hypothetical protein